MFDLIKNLFKSDGSTSFYSFYKRMVVWRESGVYPFSYNLPSSISFPSDFWQDIVKIYNETKQDGLERAISVFWADGELVLTSVVKGDERSVKSNHRISVNYIIHPTRKGYLRRELMLDGKVTKKTDVYYKKAPKKVRVEYLFNIHTHPQHNIVSDEDSFYGLFSVQDINSLISSKAVITGLITDRLWLLVRTSETPSKVNFKDIQQEDISLEKLKENWKMSVYEAQFHQKAEKK